jgi:hypothetical protein
MAREEWGGLIASELCRLARLRAASPRDVLEGDPEQLAYDLTALRASDRIASMRWGLAVGQVSSLEAKILVALELIYLRL